MGLALPCGARSGRVRGTNVCGIEEVGIGGGRSASSATPGAKSAWRSITLTDFAAFEHGADKACVAIDSDANAVAFRTSGRSERPVGPNHLRPLVAKKADRREARRTRTECLVRRRLEGED